MIFLNFSPKKYFTKTIICLSVLFGTLDAFAQVSSYTFAQSLKTYTPIVGGTVLGTATGNTSTTNLDHKIYQVSIPFIFTFNGMGHSSFYISSNGYIAFGGLSPNPTDIQPIASNRGYMGVVSAFGNNLDSIFDVAGVTGSISMETSGVAPNRVVTIQWKDFRLRENSVTDVYTLSFQIKLEETTNVISVVYSGGSNVIGNINEGYIVQVGLRGTNNSDINARKNSQGESFANSSAGTSLFSSQTVHTTNAVPGMPPAGLTYTWSPPGLLSTVEIDDKETIKVSPNPFAEDININKPELVKSIKITEVSGKLIKTINKPESVLRLQHLLKGMYILNLDMKDGTQQSIKVIKK